MIPKPLNEIEWADIESLRDSGREEDDTIEYKASFSGGSDYLQFNDNQLKKAIAGIACEAVAFLNGRGGDLVIGVREAANDHPKIEEITPIQNIDQTVDRLSQSLAALIEPTQSALSLRSIRQAEGDTEGVIIVRCQASLRAPHRFTPNKECYIRRGRSSVPMPMDEVQNLTLNRTTRLSERLSQLDERFDDLAHNRVRRTTLPAERFRIKAVYQPLVRGQIDLDQTTIDAFRGSKPTLYMDTRPFGYIQIFDNFELNGIPLLRGRLFESSRTRNARATYCCMSIGHDLAMEWDYVDSGRYESLIEPISGVFDAWVVGYFAKVLSSMKDVFKLHGSFCEGILRVKIYVEGDQLLTTNDHVWLQEGYLPVGCSCIPDFEISNDTDMYVLFKQLQTDIYSLAGIEGFSEFECPSLQ